MTTVALSLGSNIKPRLHLKKAIKELGERFGQLTQSPIYESMAVGFKGDNFLNLVILFESHEDPLIIYNWLRAQEKNHGRIRSWDKFTSRPLDIDLIAYGEQVRTLPPVLPREEIIRDAFVLRPLADVWPMGRHPTAGIHYSDLWAAFPQDSLKLWPVTL